MKDGDAIKRGNQAWFVHLICTAALLVTLPLVGFSASGTEQGKARTIRDQLGRTVVLPKKIERIVTFHPVPARIIFAFHQQDKLVGKALYGREGKAIDRVDPSHAGKPVLGTGYHINMEKIIHLSPDLVFLYAAFSREELDQFQNAGITVVGLKAETFQQSYETVRLIGRVLDCDAKAESYVADCEKLLLMLKKRITSIPPVKRLKVMFTGPRSVYSVATGDMLTSEIITSAGGHNVAGNLKGFWADISPEQVLVWNPDVILVGSSLDTYSIKEVMGNQAFRGVSAVRNGRVYAFPSNIGWWDFPAPSCVLGAVWTAKTLYPDLFRDLDVTKIADEFYTKYMGHSFTEMGGKL